MGRGNRYRGPRFPYSGSQERNANWVNGDEYANGHGYPPSNSGPGQWANPPQGGSQNTNWGGEPWHPAPGAQDGAQGQNQQSLLLMKEAKEAFSKDLKVQLGEILARVDKLASKVDKIDTTVTTLTVHVARLNKKKSERNIDATESAVCSHISLQNFHLMRLGETTVALQNVVKDEMLQLEAKVDTLGETTFDAKKEILSTMKQLEVVIKVNDLNGRAISSDALPSSHVQKHRQTNDFLSYREIERPSTSSELATDDTFAPPVNLSPKTAVDAKDVFLNKFTTDSGTVPAHLESLAPLPTSRMKVNSGILRFSPAKYSIGTPVSAAPTQSQPPLAPNDVCSLRKRRGIAQHTKSNSQSPTREPPAKKQNTGCAGNICEKCRSNRVPVAGMCSPCKAMTHGP